MQLPNYTPGFVVSYNGDTRRVRVRIPGVTDGAEVLPEAMLSLPIGQNTDNSEIRILPGDRVWLDFINGDARYPIITGYRTKDTDNAVDWLRFAQVNIELKADTDLVLTATAGKITATAGADATVIAGGSVLIQAGTKITLRAPAIDLDGAVKCLSAVEIVGHLTTSGGRTSTGSETSNGKRIDNTHTHGGVKSGGDISAGVNA